MATVQGIGICLIPTDEGVPCGRQVADGEPIGTVIWNGPQVGHKKCADGFHARKQAEERQKRLDMVKISKQAEPGGAIGDPTTYPDALASGSFPLEKKEPDSSPQPSTPVGGGGKLEFGVTARAVSPNTEDDFTDEERAEVEALKAKLREARNHLPPQAVVRVDLTALPPETTTVMLQLELGPAER